MTNQPQYPNHPPFENGPQTIKPGSPPTKAERASAEAGWKARWEATKSQPTFTHELIAAPTAWQSIPSPVRFAAWVWAISIIASLAGAALFAVLMVLGVAAGLGSL